MLQLPRRKTICFALEAAALREGVEGSTPQRAAVGAYKHTPYGGTPATPDPQPPQAARDTPK